MKIIGLVGEDPNDSRAVQNLLAQEFNGNVQFKIILRKKNGDQLENETTERALQTELRRNHYDAVVFIRDLDGPESDLKRLNQRKSWFNNLNKLTGNRGLLLLNIYELEVYILADFETFNRLYKTALKKEGNVMFKPNPKEFLKEKTRKLRKQYKESDCPELFKQLRYHEIVANCRGFKDFAIQLRTKINQ